MHWLLMLTVIGWVPDRVSSSKLSGLTHLTLLLYLLKVTADTFLKIFAVLYCY
jgi:hypothetical protein